MRLKAICISLLFVISSVAQQKSELRPPSVPLITHDPYFSIWSPADRLYDKETTHWTGKNNSIHCMIRIDGKTYRIMGNEPSYIEPIKQTGLEVTPTRTIYKFKNQAIEINLTFTSPLLVNDLDLLSRPVSYISWDIKSADKKEHDIKIYFDAHSEIAVDKGDQQVKWEYPAIPALKTITTGSKDQDVLGKRGDDLRIDWGYLYISVPENQAADLTVDAKEKLHQSFIKDGKLSSLNNQPSARKVDEDFYSAGVVFNPGKTKEASCWLMVAYDDLYSIKYFNTDLKAWWKKDGMTMQNLLVKSAKEYDYITKSCVRFDQELSSDLKGAGGDKYAEVCALVYRQCLAAHKLTIDSNGKPLMFSKENFSNGCIATVDVIYPASPFFILFSPALTKATLKPVLDYAASSKWKFPFAPHDLGTYPWATGQAYGGGETSEENQMPVEETGNMIIMLAALAKVEGNADFAKAHWDILQKWADYLLAKGFDPENQLCTDDFAGHLAHNVNLSAKSITAVACYGLLCEMLGKKEDAAKFRSEANRMVKQWIEQSKDGDHSRLAFDQPGTWSQKYNLIWDKILALNLFPDEVISKEIKYYKTMQAEFGLPLDNRERYSKNDWICWTASLSGNKNDFITFFDPVYKYVNSTPNRVPLSDWYITDNAYQRGFQARSVVGGFYIKMLGDKNIWNKWTGRGTNTSGDWAPLKLD